MTTQPVGDSPPEVHAHRRATALAALGDRVLVLPAAPARVRSRDVEHPYRPDSELFYLTGVLAPGSLAVLRGGADPSYVLFVEEPDEQSELWSGPGLDVATAAALHGADETLARTELAGRLPELLRGTDAVHYRLGGDVEVERHVRAALVHGRARGARDGSGPRALVDPGGILDELRLRKDAHEVERVRSAIRVSEHGHRVGAARVGAGVGEWEVQAELEAVFRRCGAAGPAFPTIVGAGPNACVLHYESNQARIADGDLVLVDAGAELELYCGDITRTLPADGRFAGEGRAVYDVVDAARACAVSAVRPGATIADVHVAATRRLVEGLVELGVLRGSVEGLLDEEAHKPFFPHQTSHWIGLDVHDPGDYARAGMARVLEPGMTFTVEPGLYFRPGRLEGHGERFEGIGVRIEDDVLVTDEGVEVLTAAIPTDAPGVEAWLAEAREAGGSAR